MHYGDMFSAPLSRRMVSLLLHLLVLGQLSPTTGSAKAPAKKKYKLPEEQSIHGGHECVSCEMVFSKLTTTLSGQRAQYVEMQLRGEPKTGTGFAYEWASGALYHTCDFLNYSFGEDTCRMTWTAEEADITGGKSNRTLTFEPHRRGRRARCECNGVDKVVISVSKLDKHTLPVDESCAWYHANAITRNVAACATVGGLPVANHDDIWGCMQKANCTINDDRPQFVTMRDPRPTAVSAYYHRVRNGRIQKGNKDPYILALLPYICQWVTVRHMLFAGLLSARSTIYWYEDTLARPLEFHHRWLESVGLHLPVPVVEQATEAALRDDFAFETKGVDAHLSVNKITALTKLAENNPQEGGQELALERSWRDEISADIYGDIDDVLRVWLPPVLLAKLGVEA